MTAAASKQVSEPALQKILLTLTVTLAASVMFFPIVAFADWQGTIWGQSAPQADRNFQVPHRPPTSAEIQNWFGEIKFAFEYSTSGLVFNKGALLFEDGKLYAISMKLKEPDRCDQLIEILRRLYGRPAKEEAPQFKSTKDPSLDLGSAHWITWYDEKNHNEVHLTFRKYGEPSIEDDCVLQYKSFVMPSPGQL